MNIPFSDQINKGNTEFECKHFRTNDRSGPDRTAHVKKVSKKQKIQVNERKFVCEYCDKKYVAEESLVNHMIDHGNSG